MKTIFSSKTVWFNILVAIVGILALPEFAHVLPESWLQYDALGGAIGNFLLRVFFTSESVKL